MDKVEKEVIYNFLKYGLSTRTLEKRFGKLNSRGWMAWEIRNKYKLTDSDKAKLFLYSSTQAKKIIKTFMNEPFNLDLLIKSNPPQKLEKYLDTFVIAKSEEAFHNMMKGEARNIIRDFFTPEKKIKGACQFQNCEFSGELETAHYLNERPELFKNAAKINRVLFSEGWYKYDVYNTMKSFLESHKKSKSVCFLCKKHHNILDKLKKNSRELKEFKKSITFN